MKPLKKMRKYTDSEILQQYRNYFKDMCRRYKIKMDSKYLDDDIKRLEKLLRDDGRKNTN